MGCYINTISINIRLKSQRDFNWIEYDDQSHPISIITIYSISIYPAVIIGSYDPFNGYGSIVDPVYIKGSNDPINRGGSIVDPVLIIGSDDPSNRGGSTVDPAFNIGSYGLINGDGIYLVMECIR